MMLKPLVMTKPTKQERRADLAAAQLASAAGDHATARALFAKHGIGYVVAASTFN